MWIAPGSRYCLFELPAVESYLFVRMAGPMIENLETTLRNGGVPGAPYQVGSGQAVPNFANVQLPTSLPSPAAPAGSTVPSLPARRVSSVSSSPRSISLADVPPHISPARVSTSPKHTGINIWVDFTAVHAFTWNGWISSSFLRSQCTACPQLYYSPFHHHQITNFILNIFTDETSTSEGTEKKGNEDLPTSLPTPAPPAGHDLTNARAKVTQEITQEFALIMASGTFRASEAAALAARRVLERHRMEGVSSGHPQNAAWMLQTVAKNIPSFFSFILYLLRVANRVFYVLLVY